MSRLGKPVTEDLSIDVGSRNEATISSSTSCNGSKLKRHKSGNVSRHNEGTAGPIRKMTGVTKNERNLFERMDLSKEESE